MGFFRRLKTGWALTKDSFTVLRGRPDLLLFPLISGIAGLLYIGLLFAGSYVLELFESQVTGAVVLFLFYFGTSFVAAFFNAGLTYCTREAFEGRHASVTQGLAEAWTHKGPLFAFAFISATVGLLLRAIENQDNLVAKIAATIFSVAWSIIAYFVVPVIVFEDVGVFEMFERSGQTFKNTWGETAGANFGIGLISFLFMAIGLVFAGLLAVGSMSVAGGPGLLVGGGLGLLVVLTIYLFVTALGAVTKTALYVFATDGKRPTAFRNVDLSRSDW